jgi:hypothetical protein
MLTKKVFMLEEMENKPINSIQVMDAAEAYKLEKAGKAVVLNFDELDEIENKINRAVKKFREKYDAMINSDDPVYKVDGAIEYYTNKMREELEKEVAELQAEYESIVESIKEEAKRDLATKVRFISDTERRAASDIINEAITSVKFGDGSGAIDVLIEQVPYMSESRKLALLQELPRLVDAVSDDKDKRKVRQLYQRLNEVRAGDLLPIRIAEALDTNADWAFRRLKLTHRAFKDYKNNMHNR